MKLCYIFFLSTFMWFSFQATYAYPVSFEGSNPVTTRNEARKTDFLAIHPVKYWLGLGTHYFRIKDRTWQSHSAFVKTNFQIKSWNGLDSQVNIYAWGDL